MSLENEILHAKNTQKTIFREAQKTTTLKGLAYDSGIPYNNIRGYADGTTQMPISAVVALSGVISDELMSLFWGDKERSLVSNSNGVNHDHLASICHDYLQTKSAAHHPDSPDGPAISECEAIKLTGKAASLKAVG